MSEHEPLRPLSDSQREALEEATSAYQAAVTEADARWLLGRGLSPEVADTFRLGVVHNAIPGHSRFEGFLAIPYLDKDRRPLSLRFRCLAAHDHREHGHGKYMSIAGEPPRVFNIKAIHEAEDEIHVCEGEFDAITLTAIGLPAIAIPGAQGWRNHHRRMLAGFSRVWVWGDPDDAGMEFNNKVTRALRQAKAVRLRDNDVNSTYQDGGAEALYDLLRKEMHQ